MEQFREIIALTTLGISAYTDVKERYIYIMPLIIAGVAAISISITQYFSNSTENMLAQFVSWIVFPVIAGLFIISVVHMLRDYIGMGDGCLVAAMGLLIGVITNVRLLCVAVVLSGMFSCVYLLLKGKKIEFKSLQIPFAPFLLVAYVGVLIVGT